MAANEARVLDWTKCEWTHSRKGIKFVTYQGAQTMTTTLGEVTPGHEPGPHSHVHEQLVFIMQGECDFYVDGVPHYMTAGCIMAVPPNAEHYILAKGTVPVLNLDVFTPKRPDKPDPESDRIGAKIYSKRDYRLESKIATAETKEEDRSRFDIFIKPENFEK
jgi:quercetin dioxygenase-like cupin family protein